MDINEIILTFGNEQHNRPQNRQDGQMITSLTLAAVTIFLIFPLLASLMRTSRVVWEWALLGTSILWSSHTLLLRASLPSGDVNSFEDNTGTMTRTQLLEVLTASIEYYIDIGRVYSAILFMVWLNFHRQPTERQHDQASTINNRAVGSIEWATRISRREPALLCATVFTLALANYCRAILGGNACGGLLACPLLVIISIESTVVYQIISLCLQLALILGLMAAFFCPVAARMKVLYRITAFLACVRHSYEFVLIIISLARGHWNKILSFETTANGQWWANMVLADLTTVICLVFAIILHWNKMRSFKSEIAPVILPQQSSKEVKA